MKVKHIDIYQLWIRQEVVAGRLDIVWVPTNKILADGLTKTLPRQKFKEFIYLLGLMDISHRLCTMWTTAIHDLNIIYPNHS
jgi:hypothetical protein